jgi:hypothetical protein
LRNRLLPIVVLMLAACSGKPAAKKGPVAPPVRLHPSESAFGSACDASGACPDGYFCNDDRRCQKPTAGCAPGTFECPCSGGGCNSGLRCVDDVCRDNTGFAGGACLGGDHCHTGFRCSEGVCVQCAAGTQGCTCSADGTCGETLSCLDGMCVTDSGYANAAAAATSATCVTPCSDGLTLPDGTYVACGSDGLLPGCLPGQTCQNGQCLGAEDDARTCTADTDCPDFHACLGGKCRGNCDTIDDCQSVARCVRHVCR